MSQSVVYNKFSTKITHKEHGIIYVYIHGFNAKTRREIVVRVLCMYVHCPHTARIHEPKLLRLIGSLVDASVKTGKVFLCNKCHVCTSVTKS